MFVDIENLKSALAVENILTPYKKGLLSPDKKSRLPKEPITPQVCLDILKSTNYARNIKDMLLCIAELPASEQAQFKEVVLSVFDQREQPNDILILGKKLAAAHGFENELREVIQSSDDDFLASSAERLRTIKTDDCDLEMLYFAHYDRLLCLSEEPIHLGVNSENASDDVGGSKLLPKIIEAPNSKSISFAGGGNCIGTELRKISLKKGGRVFMRNVAELPENLDVLQCDKVVISRNDLPIAKKWKYQPDALCLSEYNRSYGGRVDFSDFGEVELEYGNFEKGCELVFRDGACVHLIDYAKRELDDAAHKLPENLDVSRCDEVEIRYGDLSYLNNLCFKNGAKVKLKDVYDLPSQLDFSNCDEVDLSGCDLCNQTNLRFKDGAKVCLNNAKNLPPQLDFSHCVEVDLSQCDLCNQTRLVFMDGAKISCARAENIPHNLDFSKCSEVNLSGCNLANQPNLRFNAGAKVNLSFASNLPAHLDFSECAEVALKRCDLQNQPNLRFAENARVFLSLATNLPRGLEFSKCMAVDLSECDLARLSKLSFGVGAKVFLSRATNLPPDIDFSNCSFVDVRKCDMSRQPHMRFGEGASVDLGEATNLNGRLDFSSCAKVRMLGNDLMNVSWLGFRDRAHVQMKYVQNLPRHVDFSRCAVLNVNGANLGQQDALCFAKGARVDFFGIVNMPKFVDASLCKSFSCTEVSWANTQEILLNDRQQALVANIVCEKGWENKTYLINDMTDEQRKIWDAKRKDKLQLIRQSSEEQRLIEPKPLLAPKTDDTNVLGKFWGKMFGKGRM